MVLDMSGVRGPLVQTTDGRGRNDEVGLSGVVGLVGIVVSLALVLVLTLLSAGAFSSSKGGGSPSVFSNSSTEQQLKLCVEGRPSSYGNPPSQAQQAACTSELAGQLGGAPVESVPPSTVGSTSPTFTYPTG
jgi:hypothetical protein